MTCRSLVLKVDYFLEKIIDRQKNPNLDFLSSFFILQ